jgi:peptidoglycan/xylan/chitin deacetylase (PgdA/CDA1 family)
MMSTLRTYGKRELLARGLFWSGIALLLEQLPQRDLLLVLNYHRVGNSEADSFDPTVFSATADELDQQISYLKHHGLLVTLQEALAFIDGTIKERTSRCRVLITFDDGYLDNYDVAFPILRSHGVQGVFFLVPGIVGSGHIPWWDHIAYIMKTARKHQFTLRYPIPLKVDIDEDGLNVALRRVSSLYKNSDDTDILRFSQELKEICGGDDPPGAKRRFLNWDEARSMIRGGMAIGSHTLSHPILSHLSPDQQSPELSQSRALLKEQLDIEADVLAYPVGLRSSFTNETELLARDAGYRAAFSFYGGTNPFGAIQRYDVKRIGVGDRSMTRFRVQTAVCQLTGNYWP